MLIVSGADRVYYRSLRQFLLSLERAGLSDQLVLYDLGMTAQQRRWLSERYELRVFPFDRYPDHVRLERGAYAWKPIIVADLVSHYQGPVLWLDSATVVLGPLDRITREVERTGVYTPFGGGGPIRVLPGPLTLTGVNPELARLRTRASGVCAFDGRREWVRALTERWKQWALNGCIQNPPGARLAVHQFEQALLSLLLYDAQERGLVTLTRDALDISSPDPVPFLRTRNKVSNRIPMAADPLVRAFYRLHRWLDVLAWRLRAPQGQGDLPTRP